MSFLSTNILLTSTLLMVWLFYEANCQSCNTFDSKFECEHNSNGSCSWWTVEGDDDDYCKCGADVNLDIIFAIDSSGSIHLEPFQLEKQFLNELVKQGINNGSRLGFTLFATNVNKSRDIQYWDQSELKQYINGLRWSEGWTNTGDLLESALIQFEDTYNPDRQQVLIIITDGNPCLSSKHPKFINTNLTNCPHSVCQYSTIIKSAGIRVVIIGIGDKLTPEYVKCLTQSDSDYIPIASYDDLSSIFGSLSNITCPISKEFKITEIKAPRNEWKYRYNRFIEIYNTGIDFNVSDIILSGIVTGTGPDGVTIPNGRYLIFYDAMNTDFSPGATVTCHLCNILCDLSACNEAGNSDWSGYCWCDNSIYIPCGNTLDGSDGYGCTFQDSIGRTDWEMMINDSKSGVLIDTVVWDSNSWITTDDGYSYELIAVGRDNDDGDNWAQSCSPFGTPGAPPFAKCDSKCVINGCGGGDNNKCNTKTGLCECDPITGYYPKCNNPSSCTKCLKVPDIEECIVKWTKNGTDRYAAYSWTDSERDGSKQYQLSYFDGASFNGDISTTITNGETFKRINNYYSRNTSFGGYVQTVINQCVGIGLDQICTSYYSPKTMCVVETMSPSISPTPSPTPSPTSSPSPIPTMSPTYECPNYWWKNEDICDPDRCLCNNKIQECCLSDDSNWDDTYDENRRHKTTYDCKLDVELNKPEKRELGINDAGSSPGYLLTMGTHYFSIDISPKDYPCTMNIFWELEFKRTDCKYGVSNRRRLIDNNTDIECDSLSTDMTRTGLSIDKTSGWLKVFGQNDKLNATISFDVNRLSCDEVADDDCFNHIAIYGELKIVNATSQCQPNCYDGRIYPMIIPVWYNYNIAYNIPPTNEHELPAWLWWLIAALAIFLCLLLILIYKYWFKNKRQGAALKKVADNLDEEIEENELGWNHDLPQNQINYNNLVTGHNNKNISNITGNGPPINQHHDNRFINTPIDNIIVRTEYAATYGTQK